MAHRLHKWLRDSSAAAVVVLAVAHSANGQSVGSDVSAAPPARLPASVQNDPPVPRMPNASQQSEQGGQEAPNGASNGSATNGKKQTFYAGPDAFWFGGEYLLWWQKPTPLAVPVATLAPKDRAAILGQPNVITTIGGGNLSYGPSSGVRLGMGGWVDHDRRVGYELNYMYLGNNHITHATSVSGAPDSLSLGVPFFNPTNGSDAIPSQGLPPRSIIPNSESAVQIGYASGVTAETSIGKPGTVAVSVQSVLQGAEIGGSYRLQDRGALGITLLGNFRWLEFKEDLTLDAIAYDSPPGSFGSSLFLPRAVYHDRNRAVNDFYGINLGFRAEQSWDNLFVALTTKCALGVMHKEVELLGSSTIPAGTPSASTVVGGIYNQRSNIGFYSSERLGIVPELNLTVGYQITRHLEAYMGYTFLYMNDIYRPGDQIDRVVNPTQNTLIATPGTPSPIARPAFLGKQTDFWTHGLNFGLELAF